MELFNILKDLGLSITEILKLLRVVKQNKEVFNLIQSAIKKDGDVLDNDKTYFKYNNFLIDIEEFKKILNILIQSKEFSDIIKKIVK